MQRVWQAMTFVPVYVLVFFLLFFYSCSCISTMPLPLARPVVISHANEQGLSSSGALSRALTFLISQDQLR